MDFKELLLMADKNHKEVAKQSQQVKRLNTNFTVPAKKDEKVTQQKSEALQKLIAEKEREKQRKREAEERERRRKEKEKEEREREEKRKNTFRIPKKTVTDATEDCPSDAESFSSISSDDEPQFKSDAMTNAHQSTSGHSSSEKLHKSSSHSHSEKRDGHLQKSSEHPEKRDRHSGKASEHSSSHSSKHSTSKHSSSEQGDRHSKSDQSKHNSSDKSKHSSSEKRESDSSKSHRSSDKDKSRSDGSHSHSHKDKSRSDGGHSHSHKDKSRSDGSHSHSHKDKSRSDGSHSHSHKDKSRSDGSHSHSHKDKSRSDGSHSHSHKDKSRSDGSHSQSHTSHHSSDKLHHKESKDRSSAAMENDSSGYITSPDISSGDENPPQLTLRQPSNKESKAPTQRRPSDENHPSLPSRKPSNRVAPSTSTLPSNKNRLSVANTMDDGDPDGAVTLVRHHLKPNIDRVGGSIEQRNKMLEKLQAIREKMAENEPGESRKRASWGEVKKRRAKREKIDGVFTGSCMEKVNYDEEEKPSLKRPEPKPEEPKRMNSVKRRDKNKFEKSQDRKKVAENHRPDKVNRFDERHEKPKVKPKPRLQPPPVSFADLMKIAEQKHVLPVMVTVEPKKKEERRPMTQEELDRKEAREKWLKSKECREYRYGTGATTETKDSAVKSDSPSGGFLRQNHNVIPPASGIGQSKSFAIPRKRDINGNAKTQKPSFSSESNRPSTSSISVSKPIPGAKPRHPSEGHPAPKAKPRPDPTRPGMITNKPSAMAQRSNGESKLEPARPGGEPKRNIQSSSQNSSLKPHPRDSSSSQPRLQSSGGASGSKGSGNAWDALFSRPEYKKMSEPAPKKRKNVIDSEEDDYEDEDDMDDFIDDDDEEEPDVSSHIRQLFGYDKRKYRYDDDDDSDMEASFTEVMKEEARSARLGLKEDLEDIRREQEELRQKALKKKKMKKF